MSHALDGFRLKLHWANDRLEALKADVEAWFKQQPYGIIGEYEPGPPEKYVFSFRLFDPPPPRWGLLIGEFAYHARSALDHLAWQLVLLNGNEPGRRTGFPIILSPFDWGESESAVRLRGASERHIGLVEGLQPYNRRTSEGMTWVFTSIDDPLALLSFLNNEDKHRVLVPTVAALSSVGYDIAAVRDVAPITDTGVVVFGSLVDRAPLLRIPVTATGPNPEVEMQFNERVHITIDHRIDIRGGGSVRRQRIDVLDEMEEIRTKLRRIFEMFVREFG